MDNEDEQYSFTEDVSFIEGAIATVWGLGSVIGGFVLMLWLSSWFLKPDNYVPPKKEEIKVEQIVSTKPLIKHEVTVEANVTVSDGVTKRTMKSKMTADSVTHDMIKTVNDNMLQATYKMVDVRQREVNADKNYWNKNVINYNKEQK